MGRANPVTQADMPNQKATHVPDPCGCNRFLFQRATTQSRVSDYLISSSPSEWIQQLNPHRTNVIPERRYIMAAINLGDKTPDFFISVTLKDKTKLRDVLKNKKVIWLFTFSILLEI
jgi:hypothetical protein